MKSESSLQVRLLRKALTSTSALCQLLKKKILRTTFNQSLPIILRVGFRLAAPTNGQTDCTNPGRMPDKSLMQSTETNSFFSRWDYQASVSREINVASLAAVMLAFTPVETVQVVCQP